MVAEKIDKVAWICIKDGKVLCARSKGKDVFYMPGGKREKGETDSQALIREIKEELTVDLVPDSLKHMGIFEAPAHGKPEGTMVQLKCYVGDYTGNIRADSEIAEVAWLGFGDKNKLSVAGQDVLDWLKHWNLIR
ncbi:ADP-ribose pyrophosphatase [uncultured archaeon]|nr:ADP-ribose pyrophosphatase [uncultured archaeon]